MFSSCKHAFQQPVSRWGTCRPHRACRPVRHRGYVVAAASEVEEQAEDLEQQPKRNLTPQQRQKRAAIAERIKSLRKRNDALKQAIGVFLDKPGDTGVVTGARTTSTSTDGLPDAATSQLVGSLRNPLLQQVYGQGSSSSNGAASDPAAMQAAAEELASQLEGQPPGVRAVLSKLQQMQVNLLTVAGSDMDQQAEVYAEYGMDGSMGAAEGWYGQSGMYSAGAVETEQTDSPQTLVFVSAEVAPWSKTGGLGDVIGALPVALAARGHRVMVVTARYTNGGKDLKKYEEAKEHSKSVWVELSGGWHELKYFTLHKNGVDWVFIDHLSFQRPGTPYGSHAGPFNDNLFRFGLLSLGALEAPLNLPIKRDRRGRLTGEAYGQDVTFIANDWHAAMVPVLLKSRYRKFQVYAHAASLVCIHNLAHQGAYPANRFAELALPGDVYPTFEWKPPDAPNQKQVNVLKAGLVSADALITVSQGYAFEIVNTPQVQRVDLLLKESGRHLRGIVNGIDTQEWNPATDNHLVANYSADDLSGKAACKAALQQAMNLPPEPNVPLVGFIGRLDYQKGPDLLLDALPNLVNLDCQVVLLGSGAADYEARVNAATRALGWAFRGYVGFSVPLAHQIIAGCDVFIMPSRFEPCGLNQLYAMRYGTVPIAHSTGGLIDTIDDYNPFAKGEGEGTGWTFAPATVEAMMDAVSTAIRVYREDKERWQALQLRGMRTDFGWDRAARQYENVLTELVPGAVAAAAASAGAA